MVDEQADVMQLDLMPDRHRLLAGFEFLFQTHRGFEHTNIVELNSFALCTLLTMPVCGFETMLGIC